MNKLIRSKVIINKLEILYPETPVPLNHKNVFTLLVAVVLSAQSTDKKVNELTLDLFEKASTPSAMYKLGELKIYNYIKQLGLAKTKARNVYNLSKFIDSKFHGEVPKNFKDLESLPGVGHKTSSVVLAQAFGIPTFPVDTHIHRLAQRWKLTDGSSVKSTERDLKNIFPKHLWNKLHLQMIFYGREFCTAKGCDGRKCELCRELFPKRKVKFIHKKA